MHVQLVCSFFVHDGFAAPFFRFVLVGLGPTRCSRHDAEAAGNSQRPAKRILNLVLLGGLAGSSRLVLPALNRIESA